MKYVITLITKDIVASTLSLLLIAVVFIFICASYLPQCWSSNMAPSGPTKINHTLDNTSGRTSNDVLEAMHSGELHEMF